MLHRIVVIALTCLLMFPSIGLAQEGVPDDLSVDESIYVGKLVVWFELTAPAAFDLTDGFREPAWDDPDWAVRMDGAVGVILAVDRSVQRAEDIGPVVREIGPVGDVHGKMRSLYAAIAGVANTCDRALAASDGSFAVDCRRQMSAAYDALLAFQVELGLFVEFSPNEIDRAPRRSATPASD